MNETSISSQRLLKFPPHGEPRFYRFAPFELDTASGQLFRDGVPVPLPPKAIELLKLLVQHRGELLPKEALKEALWPDTFVDDSNLNQHVFVLRKTLGKKSIETVPRRGYRFVPAVTAADGPLEVSSALGARPTRRAWTIAAGALIAVALTAGLHFVTRAAPAEIRSIAVLPFRNVTPVAGGDYLGIGLADAVITRLGYSRHLRVASTAAIASFKDEQRPLEIAKRLETDAVLTGTIQQTDEATRVAVQLVRAEDGRVLWSDTFEATRRELFTLQDIVAAAVLRALDGSGSTVASRATRPEAYEAFLKGRWLWNRRTSRDFVRAREQFQIAIEHDAEFAPAWAGLADAHNFLGDATRGRKAAERALELDANLAEAWAALANVKMLHDYDWDGAERDLKRAIALNPSYATAHQWYAFLLVARGRTVAARESIRRARELDPVSLIIATDVGQIDFYARRYEEALAQFRRVTDLDPNFAQARSSTADALLFMGKHEDAARELVEYERLIGPAPALRAAFGCLTPENLQKLEGDRPDACYLLARLSSMAGDADRAFRHLQRCLERRDGNMAMMGVDPLLDPIRADARFVVLLHGVGLR